MKRLAWGLWVLLGLISAACFVLVMAAGGDTDEGLAGIFILYATAGALIVAQDRGNLVGWLLLVIAFAFTLQSFGEAYVSSSLTFAREYVGWLAGWLWYVWMATLAVFLPLVFPTGRVPGPRWRPVVWLGLAALALSLVGAAFKPGDMDLSAPVDNPFGVRGALEDIVAAAAVAGNVVVLVAFVLAGASLVVRFRRARGTERAQIKWFAFIGLLATVALVLAMFEVLFSGGWRRVLGQIGWDAFLLLAILGIPAATAIAILRHGLYDIDVVIRRTLVYGALTATLAAGYLGCVLLAQLVIGADSSLAVAASTLAMAALFRPARERIQAFVDRRFYRRRYDAALTLERFGSQLRDELDLEAVGADLRAVVRDTMQPAHVSLWLRTGAS